MKLKNSRWTMVMLGVVCWCLLALSAATGISTANSQLLYVKPTPSGSGNCIDWDNACDLQTALAKASEAGEGEIWVAEGSHKPATGIDRTATFQLASGVALYGGFAGTEASRDQRDWTLHETMLSGDIGMGGDSTDNTYHVVTGSGADATAILDGFTITGGNADGTCPLCFGGGMYNYGGSPTLTNLTFDNDSALGGGAGMYNYDSSPTLTNVTFSDNSDPDAGGGMYNQFNSNPTLTNVTFSGNSANDGGAMYNWDQSSPTLTNVTFSGNSADNNGAAIANLTNASPTLTNVTFSGNSVVAEGGGMYNWEQSSPTLTDVTFSGNSADNDGGGMDNYESSPTLINVTLNGNSAAIWGGGMHNNNSSPTLTNVTLSGNSAASGGGMYNYSGSSPTVTNSILWGNTATSAGAQIYNNNSAPTISYSLVEGSGGSGASWDDSLGTDGGGNIDADPKFVDADGPDDTVGTLDDDPRVQLTSPAIDAGDNTAVPAGIAADLDGRPRFVDIPSIPDTGVGPAPIVDMGAYEVQIHIYLPLVMKHYAP